MQETGLLLLTFAANTAILIFVIFVGLVIFLALRGGINFIVDSITALFGKGPRAKKPPAADR